ncbi:hypothetical protein P152DRAFT_499608, partial [Eremomyces bilateralis CBS 781.70]
ETEEGEEDHNDGGDDDDDEPRLDKSDEFPTMTPVQTACLEFCIQLLNHKVMRNEYESALVCVLAVLGVNGDTWRDPETYPPILSSTIKCARFMVIQKAVNMAGPLEEPDRYRQGTVIDFEGSNSGYESSNRIPRSIPTRKVVNRMIDGFMVRGSKSPMQWMLNLRTYRLKIHYNTTARGHVEWNDGETLLYKGTQFSMAQFRGMVHGLLFETRQIMAELLFCTNDGAGDMPIVPWELLRDDPTNGRPGWNFLQDQRTRFPVNGETWLFDRISEHEAIEPFSFSFFKDQSKY